MENVYTAKKTQEHQRFFLSVPFLMIDISLCRYAIKLLEDLVFFVVDQTNTGQPVLDVVMIKANRERQKLMREQHIIKQVLCSRSVQHFTVPQSCRVTNYK